MLWLLSMWEKAGRPSPVNIIELGPGTGVMMMDMLRVNRYYVFLFVFIQINKIYFIVIINNIF